MKDFRTEVNIFCLRDMYDICKKYKLNVALEINDNIYGIKRESSYIADDIWFEKLKLIPFDMKNNFYENELVNAVEFELETEKCWKDDLYVSPMDKLGGCEFRIVIDDKTWDNITNKDIFEDKYTIKANLRNNMFIIKLEEKKEKEIEQAFIELAFEKPLYDILDIYTEKDWRNEPLNSDEVNRLVRHLRNQLELINGNITNEEYQILEE